MKTFTFNGIDHAARTYVADQLIQISIFTTDDYLRYHGQIALDTIDDSQAVAMTEAMTVEKLVNFAIDDFKRLADESLP